MRAVYLKTQKLAKWTCDWTGEKLKSIEFFWGEKCEILWKGNNKQELHGAWKITVTENSCQKVTFSTAVSLLLFSGLDIFLLNPLESRNVTRFSIRCRNEKIWPPPRVEITGQIGPPQIIFNSCTTKLGPNVQGLAILSQFEEVISNAS